MQQADHSSVKGFLVNIINIHPFPPLIPMELCSLGFLRTRISKFYVWLNDYLVWNKKWQHCLWDLGYLYDLSRWTFVRTDYCPGEQSSGQTIVSTGDCRDSRLSRWTIVLMEDCLVWMDTSPEFSDFFSNHCKGNNFYLFCPEYFISFQKSLNYFWPNMAIDSLFLPKNVRILGKKCPVS